jgi:hypothetical protein
MILSGERALESAGRGQYLEVELDQTDCRNNQYRKPGFEKKRTGKDRYVDRCRPVHKWTEQQVWDIMKKYSINPHPAYRLGWGRLSCMTCIFGNCNQWATIKIFDRPRFDKILAYEKQFGVTIKNGQNIEEVASAMKNGKPLGKPLVTPYVFDDPKLVEAAKSIEFTEDIILQEWVLPKGAFGDSDGPT